MGMTEDEMVGWHHWLNGHEFEQALGDSEEQGSLVCCSPWGRKESDMTDWTTTIDILIVYITRSYEFTSTPFVSVCMTVILEKIKSNNVPLKLTLFLNTVSAESDFKQKQEYYCQAIIGNIMNVPFRLSRHTINLSGYKIKIYLRSSYRYITDPLIFVGSEKTKYYWE